MKANRAIVVLAILWFIPTAAFPETRQGCVDRAKAEAQLLSGLPSPQSAADVKRALEKIVSTLKSCDFQSSELFSLLTFQRAAAAEVDRLAKAGKRLNVEWYKKEVLKRLDALATAPVPAADHKAGEGEPGAAEPGKAEEGSKGEPGAVPTKPGPDAKKIDSSFPIGEFVRTDPKDGAPVGIPVDEFEDLKTRIEVLEKSVDHLTRDLRAARTASAIALAALILSVLALGVGGILLAGRFRRPGRSVGGPWRVGR